MVTNDPFKREPFHSLSLLQWSSRMWLALKLACGDYLNASEDQSGELPHSGMELSDQSMLKQLTAALGACWRVF